MIRMDVDSSLVRFKLNPRFYSKESILSTIDAFGGVCSGSFDENTFSILLTPKEKVDSERLVGEFCNYCLSLMK